VCALSNGATSMTSSDKYSKLSQFLHFASPFASSLPVEMETSNSSDIIMAALWFLMAALRSRCGHYVFVLFLSSSFFPGLMSAVAD